MPPRAVIDERERFRFGNTSRLAKIPLRCLASGAGRSKTRADGDSRHLGERVERSALRLSKSLARPNVELRADRRFRRQSRSVKQHALGPFMISIDPDADLLVERNVRTWRRGNRCGAAPVRSKKCREKKASHPPEILK